MNSSTFRVAHLLFAALLVTLAGGCEDAFARQTKRSREALELGVFRAKERLLETGNPVYQLHIEQQQQALTSLFPSLPSVPTPFYAFLARHGSYPMGKIIVHWIETGEDVAAIEIRTRDDSVIYPVEYSDRTLGEGHRKQIYRTYCVYFADETGTHPHLSPHEVIVFSHGEGNELLTGTLATSVRLIYGDQKESEWLICIPPISSVEPTVNPESAPDDVPDRAALLICTEFSRIS